MSTGHRVVVTASRSPGSPAAGDAWEWEAGPGAAEGERKGEGEVLRWRWIPPGRFRMGARGYYPREAEWEYACRAGTRGEYWSGDGEERLNAVGWYEGNSGGVTHPVGRKPGNGWGLRDMHGNVWEWCRDEYDPTAYEGREDGWDASRTVEGMAESPRVLRGGSCADQAVCCRSAYRAWGRPDVGDYNGGFRACLFPGPA